eukprot:TRINITY_DN18363_c1_g1_i1.p2 TRINITY_DN18363_c1_g1~~TRINITY_DN18363_c1_g1_i1.p2  ORF type:complete len:119 (-),score=3.71 TRINITY_DN18363_c1_g1_i1:461-817(-)
MRAIHKATSNSSFTSDCSPGRQIQSTFPGKLMEAGEQSIRGNTVFQVDELKILLVLSHKEFVLTLFKKQALVSELKIWVPSAVNSERLKINSNLEEFLQNMYQEQKFHGQIIQQCRQK